MLKVEIDNGSGFCFGVTTAIKKAEEQLSAHGELYCLGDIVHNGREVERLRQMGLHTVEHEDLPGLSSCKVMLRAHGEPPQTYEQAEKYNIQLIDATCPVVLHLQRRIKAEYDENQGEQRQIVIYGKNGHAEVIGLVGQTNGTAIVVENLNDASRLDFSRGISLYSQTTMSLAGFREIVDFIMNEMKARGTESQFRFFDTICRQVANRISDIRTFASNHDVIVFVCGKKSSNGRILYNECLQQNPQTHMVEQPKEIQPEWFNESSSVGICGATSTPKWLMEQCADAIRNMKL